MKINAINGYTQGGAIKSPLSSDVKNNAGTVDKSIYDRTDSIDIKGFPDTEQAEELSESKKFAEELKAREEHIATMEAEAERMKADAEAAKEEIEAYEKMFDTYIKCLKISGNIISGNNVPPADHNFLMENDPELYMMSVNARLPNDDPEDMERVSKDEEEQNSDAVEHASQELSDLASASPSTSPENSTESSESNSGDLPAELPQ